MRLLIILVLATLSLMGALVARDNSYKAEPSGRDVTQADAFLKTERGQDLQRLGELMQAGDEEAFQREHAKYREKYNAPPLGGWPETGDAKKPTQLNSTPMTLPPEAR